MGVRQLRRGKILVVEKDPFVRQALTHLLSTAHDVKTASNGREALAAFTPGYYDVVLIDLETSETSGDRVARVMKRMDLPLTTVLIVGCELQETDPRLADFDFRVQKPFPDLGDIAEMVTMGVQMRETRTIAMSG